MLHLYNHLKTYHTVWRGPKKPAAYTSVHVLIDFQKFLRAHSVENL